MSKRFQRRRFRKHAAFVSSKAEGDVDRFVDFLDGLERPDDGLPSEPLEMTVRSLSSEIMGRVQRGPQL